MNDCACLYGYDGDNLPEIFTQVWRKAIKPHICVECKRTIEKSERYEAYSGKWDGVFHTYHTCAACQDIRESLHCNNGWAFGRLWRDIANEIFSTTGLTIACVNKCVTLEGKRYLQQRWMEWVEK